jgi:hypothetical protein
MRDGGLVLKAFAQALRAVASPQDEPEKAMVYAHETMGLSKIVCSASFWATRAGPRRQWPPSTRPCWRR